MRPDGFVLAGGHATRMGFDKARAPWNDQPMALVLLRTLTEACGRVALIRRGEPDGLPWRWEDGTEVEVLREADDGPRHPLWGVATALRAARTEHAVVVPCDVPRLTAASVRSLIGQVPAIAAAAGRANPLVGAFPREWADRAEAQAQSGGSATAFAADAARVDVLAEELANVNAPADLPQPGPVARLLARLPFLPPEAHRRVIEGERGRLAARGMLDPGPDRFELGDPP